MGTRTLLSALLVAFVPVAAPAGPNEGGTLVLHVRPNFVCTACDDICGESLIASCAEALSHASTVQPSTWWVFASFPPESEPRLAGLTFGIDYGPSESLYVVDWGHCGDFELPNPDWPASGSGTAVTWSPAQTSAFSEIYWFEGYDYYGVDAHFALIPHPGQGGNFGDDTVPSNIDAIADYGVLGFFGEPGYLPCAGAPGLGACCFEDEHCGIVYEHTCLDQGGEFQGEGTVCEPSPCNPPCVPFLLRDRPSATAPAPDAARNPFAADRTVMAREPGPNAGGGLILHTNPDLIYTDEGEYCGESGLTACEDARTTADATSPVVVHILAAFPGTPRLRGVTFGIEFDHCVQFADWQACGDFELADPNWPESGTGTAVVWNDTQTGSIVEIYWLGAYVPVPEIGVIRSIPHPREGGFFGDDSVPSVLDPIAAYGTFGFFTPGSHSCPEPLPGACCIESECVVLTGEDCLLAGGEYRGNGTDCDPDPCVPVAVRAVSWGEIKASFRDTH